MALGWRFIRDYLVFSTPWPRLEEHERKIVNSNCLCSRPQASHALAPEGLSNNRNSHEALRGFSPSWATSPSLTLDPLTLSLEMERKPTVEMKKKPTQGIIRYLLFGFFFFLSLPFSWSQDSELFTS